MKKQLGIFLVLMFCASVALPAESKHKHQAFDMLVGIDFGVGFGVGGGMTDAVSGFLRGDIPTQIKKGYFDFGVSLGVNYDFYLFHWLSFNTGLSVAQMAAVTIRKNVTSFEDEIKNTADSGIHADDYIGMYDPLMLVIPIMAHVNVPFVEWLYAGVGININIPIKSVGLVDLMGGFVSASNATYVSLPIDVGFDFANGKSGNTKNNRFFFRIEPSFLPHGDVIVPIGFVAQFVNFKVYSK